MSGAQELYNILKELSLNMIKTLFTKLEYD